MITRYIRTAFAAVFETFCLLVILTAIVIVGPTILFFHWVETGELGIKHGPGPIKDFYPLTRAILREGG